MLCGRLLLPSLFRLTSTAPPCATSSRALTCGVLSRYKKIDVVEEGNEIVVKGVQVASPRTAHLVHIETRAGCGSNNCHALCRWEHVDKIKHTGEENDQ
jgi:hypothetical protein